MQIEWKKSYELDYPLIDEQHKYLVDLINQLANIVGETNYLNGTMNLNEINELYGRLEGYVKVHFTTEEALFEEWEFDATEHLEIHKAFIKRLDDAQQMLNDNKGANELADWYNYLFNWLVDHIMGEDQKYYTYIKR